MPICTSSASNLTCICRSWAERLMSKDYGQHHILSMMLYPNKTLAEAMCVPVDEVRNQVDNLTAGQLSHLASQLESFERVYPGGVLSYLTRARKLLQDAKNQVNSFDGFTPFVPEGVALEAESDEFMEMENIGMTDWAKMAFVLVAGGLGERLGSKEIKISLPAELVTGRCFMDYYAAYILAFQRFVEKARRENEKKDLNEAKDRERKLPVDIPLAIMTSDDTHTKTCKLLETNNYFGLKKEQVFFIKQGKVAALLDNEAHIAVRERAETGEGEQEGLGRVMLETKPHGHGDVHTLLLEHGLIDRWGAEGRKWVIFFQDTNALVFRGVPAALGVSIKHNFAMNTITVPRKPGEAVGAICRLQQKDGRSLTLNVEYNVLEPLLKGATGKGDVADPLTGNSAYPGNTNTLIVNLQAYAEAIKASEGEMPEFVNPKYKDETRTTFKSSTRLECMLQELPRLFPSNRKVGFTQMSRWVTFSPVKNSPADAAAKMKGGSPGECALTGEMDLYINNLRQLQMAYRWLDAKNGTTQTSQMCLNEPDQNNVCFNGVSYKMPAKIVLHPSWALTRTQMCEQIVANTQLSITNRSTLIVEGKVELGGLYLDGTLSLSAEEGGELKVSDLSVVNNGYYFQEITDTQDGRSSDTVRGYEIVKKGIARYVAKADTAGPLVLNGKVDQND